MLQNQNSCLVLLIYQGLEKVQASQIIISVAQNAQDPKVKSKNLLIGTKISTN